MRERNITQYKLSKALGFSNSTISNWRSDSVRPEGDKIVILADYFGVSVDYLMARTDDPRIQPGDASEPLYLSQDEHELLASFRAFSPSTKSHVDYNEAMALAKRISLLSEANQTKALDYLELLENQQNK